MLSFEGKLSQLSQSKHISEKRYVVSYVFHLGWSLYASMIISEPLGHVFCANYFYDIHMFTVHKADIMQRMHSLHSKLPNTQHNIFLKFIVIHTYICITKYISMYYSARVGRLIAYIKKLKGKKELYTIKFSFWGHYMLLVTLLVGLYAHVTSCDV